MKVWDAILIGAGPAGSITALQLARQGASVLLLDKASFPRTKVCGCCLNAEALAVLDELELDGLDWTPTRRFVLHAGGRSLTLPLNGAAISRAALDDALVRAAQCAGAVFHDCSSATVGAIDGQTRTVRVGERWLCARVIIAADGLQGKCIDTGWRTVGRSYMGVAAIVQGAMPAEQITMVCGAHGYVGMVRLQNDRVNVAAALLPGFIKQFGGGGPGAAAAAVLREAGVDAPASLADATWRGVGLLSRRRLGVALPRVFVVGDAGGYIEPITGEGMTWAMQSALEVVPLALAAVTRWDDRLMAQWSQRYRRCIRRRQWRCRVVSALLRRPRLLSAAMRVLSDRPRLAGVLQLERRLT